MPLEPIAPGLHESLVTTDLRTRLPLVSGLEVETETVDPADLPHILAQHVYASARRAFTERNAEDSVELANQLIHILQDAGTDVETPATQLLRIAPTPGPGVVTYQNVRPRTPLAEAALLTNGKSEPSLGPELRAEIDTADRVDLLCAFVKWSGLRLLDPELRRLRERGGRLRVITTTYMGATERRALDRLVRDSAPRSTSVRASDPATRQGLAVPPQHRLRHRLRRLLQPLPCGAARRPRVERPALPVATPALLEKFDATFDTYWEDAASVATTPTAIATGSTRRSPGAGGRADGRVTSSSPGSRSRPYPHQQEILDGSRSSGGPRPPPQPRRGGDRHRQDGRRRPRLPRLCGGPSTERPTLLFVAHRKEILDSRCAPTARSSPTARSASCRRTARARSDWRHVFASVQSLTATASTNIPADAFDVVVIDEFHHAEAPTYRAAARPPEPSELLGLTATPERTDGVDVREFFDGRTAAELRLWDALGADLLCPFHYFGIADNTDLTQLEWKRGGYDDGELAASTPATTPGADRPEAAAGQDPRHRRDARARLLRLRRARRVHGASLQRGRHPRPGRHRRRHSRDERAAALQDLRRRRGEHPLRRRPVQRGPRPPDVDTVLFLRPTQSATVFLQQLGRGLRRTPDKAVLTVLDFIGQQRESSAST